MTTVVDTAGLSAAALALITACCPGSPQLLRSALSKPWTAATFTGERISLEFDVPDQGAQSAAADLVNRSNNFTDPIVLAVLGCTVADVTAWVEPDCVLVVDALVINNAAPVQPWGGVR